MNRLRTLFHPIIIFIGVQIAWIILMAIWINWYVKNSRSFKRFAEQMGIGPFSDEFNWLILLEGCVLMLIILAGVYIIFVYWNKQARLNRLQSNFVSSVSHELKSPLASIQLYLETLKYRDVTQQETRDFVETMLSDTERLSGLIENILEAGKHEQKNMPMRFQPVEIGPFLQEVLHTFKRQFEERGTSVQVAVQDSPVLQMDKRGMRIVFGNLIGNALRYSPPNSRVSVSVKNVDGHCDIEFADEGIGIDRTEMKKLFRKFYRVQNRETQDIEGAGLGLYIAREIVKGHDGKISVSSEGREKGARFTVSLPLRTVNMDGKQTFFSKLFE